MTGGSGSHAPGRAAAASARRLLRDAAPSTVGAGFLVVLVSYAGPLLIYLQAAREMGVSAEVFSSWVFGISVAAGITTIALSLYYRAPIVTAWSAPGTVLLISVGERMPFAEIVGAYMAVAAVLIVLGATGVFDRLVRALPPAVASGMMAGILFGFGLHAVAGIEPNPLLGGAMLAAYLVFSAIAPRYAVILLLALGVALSWVFFDAPLQRAGLSLATLSLTAPAFSLEALLTIGVPVLITTLTGQFLPGMAILRANGYRVDARPILIFSGTVSLAAALLGGITTALASITMALAASPESHPDPERRYTAAVAGGVFYILGGVFAGSLVVLLTLLPTTMIAILAGLALLGAISKSLQETLGAEAHVQAGVLTFLVTTSGVEVFGVGSSFWGVVVGVAATAAPTLSRRFMVAER